MGRADTEPETKAAIPDGVAHGIREGQDSGQIWEAYKAFAKRKATRCGPRLNRAG